MLPASSTNEIPSTVLSVEIMEGARTPNPAHPELGLPTPIMEAEWGTRTSTDTGD